MSKKKNPTIASRFADMRADYDMTKQSRFVRKRTGVNPRGSGPDYHFRNQSNYYAAIEQARDMDRNDALIGILADRRIDNIVQGGFKLDPKTGDKGLDLELWNRWQEYATTPDLCDITGEMTWHEMERVICRAECVDGDIVAVGTQNGSIQLIESHLVQTLTTVANTFLGVETDSYGKRTKYHILREVDEFGTKQTDDPIDVRNADGVRQLFHVYNPKRVLMTRGVTALAPVFSYAGMLEDINFAKLVQQQIVSCFAIFREMAANANQSGLPSTDAYGNGTTVQTDYSTRLLDEVAPGMEITGRPGEKLQGFSPNVPNSEYFQQVRLILQILGVNFGLPLCLVLMDGSETNFSGWRGAVDEARKGFVADQQNLVTRFHRPAYTWWLHNLIATDSSIRKFQKKKNVNLFAHNWNLPTWSYIEPVADAEGDAVQLRNALTSPRRLHAARGNDWEELSEEIVDDNLYAIENAARKADEFNKRNPTAPPLNWRDLIALPMPEGQTIALQDPAVVEANAQTQQVEAAKAGAEMLGVNRSDWNNMQKAKRDILNAFVSGEFSEQRARLELDSIGVPPDKVELYIADARDGSIDSEDLNNG
jgi:lambda family phage portal protein